MSEKSLVLGTRGSALALRQARLVQKQLEGLGFKMELRIIKTTGDRILDVPLSGIGDKGLFTKELDLALLEGSIQLAVHSLKDLPTQLPDGLVIAAVTEREDPRDAFVAHPTFSGGLVDVPEGAMIATGSLRRRAQLKAWRGDLAIEPLRGNVDTRLQKLDGGDWTGIVLAAAGLLRLGMEDRITEIIDPSLMLPAAGQGALAIVCEESDVSTQRLLRARLHHVDTFNAVIAERALLHRLQGGCSIPVGSYATVRHERLVVEGCVADLEGRRIVRARREGLTSDAESMGRELGDELIARGAGAILDEIRNKSS